MTEIQMPSNPSPWRRVTALYAKLLEILLGLCVGILVIPVTLQIVSRYTPFIPSYIWTEEMARFLFIWTIMLVDAVNHREREGATETTVLGPFYVGEHKVAAHGTDISPRNLTGEKMFVQSRVTDLQGKPLAGVPVDVWHACDRLARTI